MPNTTKKYKRTYKDKVKIKEKSSQRLQTDFQTRLGLKKKKTSASPSVQKNSNKFDLTWAYIS